ncbi:MAG TPA: phenylalanine--tRNA ligase subunit beta [Planctomycetota bacterium]
MSWLRDYVDVPGSPADVAKLLVFAGVGVESVEGDVLDLEITANRADLLSMLGVARDVAVLRRTSLKTPPVPDVAGAAPDVKVDVRAPELCPRYTARLIRGVKVGPSPAWLASKLEAAGLRPVNNVVDVTNFVLLESGQPLHAFDARVLRGNAIVVRRAAPGEKIVAIDGKTYELTKDALVIADAERPVAVAGVMGGKESEIGAGTSDVLLESAQFDPVSIRRTSKRLALSSDSSYRFERGVDWDTVDWASRRAAQLIVQLAGGQASGVVDVSVRRPERPVAKVRPARVAKVLGMAVAPARVKEILEGLGCAVTGTDELGVTSPVGRRDLKIEVDYIEEVARVEGYDKIPCDTSFGLKAAVDNAEDLVREAARATLAGLGAYEVLTWSFAKAGTPNRVPFWTDGPLIPLRDPQGNVDRTLRESLAPGLLEALKTNEDYKEPLRPVFEIARVYLRKGKGYGERDVLGLAVPGDPLGVKGYLDTLAGRLGLALEVRPAEFPFLEPGSAAELRLNGARVGYLGAAPGVLRTPVATAEVDFEALVAAARLTRPYRDFPRQPPVERDLSITLPEATTWRQVEEAVRSAAPATLEAVRFLSEYRGQGIPAGEKGWAFSMTYRAADRTLSGGEVEAGVQSVLKALEERLAARRR